METKRKKKIFNIIMAALIAVVIICGVMMVGNLKGWFGETDSAVSSDSVSGVVNIERGGVAYALDKKIAIENGDLIETKNSSFADFRLSGDGQLGMNKSAEIVFENCSEENIDVAVNSGEIFVNLASSEAEVKAGFGGNAAEFEGGVASISVQNGSWTVNVFAGQVEVTDADGAEHSVGAGETLEIVKQSDGTLDVSQGTIAAEALNDFLIGKLKDNSLKDEICFTQDELDKVTADREKENKAAEDAEGDVISSSGSKGSNSKSESKTEHVNTCTIQIRCETILKNMDNLASGKERFVPSNGIILATSTVEFEEGETVFDVLKRACSYAGIQLEYSYTPLYESYYIEGINNLYEFDCGPQSGWMYKVNGWFPNYGCSGYELKDGDNIVWTYTCNGLGKDVGGNVR